MTTKKTLSPDHPKPIAYLLLEWGLGQRDGLPWRQERSPYRVWVSEVILQQTQVANAIPYFHRFMRAFPDVSSLAAAPLAEVLKAWEGLGYYARARNLHRAACILMEKHGGRLPNDRQTLLALPGIGSYTAGAILSLAFGQDEPALDGNARRVLCRLFAIEDDLRASETESRLWGLARTLIPSGQVGSFNEALMDLGSLICHPRHPLCPQCPVQIRCQAHTLGIEGELPRHQPRRPLPHFDVTAAVIRDEAGRLLVAQRPYDKLLGGLWEFPGGKCERGETLSACLVRELREELGIGVQIERCVTSVKHAYSHFRITLHAFECTLTQGEPEAREAPEIRWVAPEHLDQLAFSSADHKVIQAIAPRHDGRISRQDEESQTGEAIPFYSRR